MSAGMLRWAAPCRPLVAARMAARSRSGIRSGFVNIAESQNGGGGWDPVNANPIGQVLAVTVDKKF